MKLLLLLVCLSGIYAQQEPEALKVSVYYESLCPDSIQFINNQLYPTVNNFPDNILNIDLVPFGNAQTSNKSGVLNFTCQHGPLECYGNKVQSCVLVENSPEKSLEFVNCAMKNKYAANDASLKNCAKITSVSWNKIQKCLNNGEADKLLAENGIRTQSVKPEIRYVPTIIFNDVYNQTLQNDAENNFLNTVCLLLKEKPQICSLAIYFDDKHLF